jgi:hypothetical protein
MQRALAQTVISLAERIHHGLAWHGTGETTGHLSDDDLAPVGKCRFAAIVSSGHCVTFHFNLSPDETATLTSSAPGNVNIRSGVTTGWPHR